MIRDLQIPDLQIPNHRESRADTVIRHVKAYIFECPVTREAYADNVREVCSLLYPEPSTRPIKFHELEDHGGNSAAMLKANDQLVRRILDGEVKMLANVEELLVFPLPPERRIACARELSERFGLVAAPAPQSTAGSAAMDLARLLKSTAEAIEAIAPMMADGVIDERDAPLAKKALTRITAAQGELVAWSARLTAILPDVQGGA